VSSVIAKVAFVAIGPGYVLLGAAVSYFAGTDKTWNYLVSLAASLAIFVITYNARLLILRPIPGSNAKPRGVLFFIYLFEICVLFSIGLLSLSYTLEHKSWPNSLLIVTRSLLMIFGFRCVLGSLGLLDEYGALRLSKIHKFSKKSTAAIESTEKGPNS
jgi:hypothetical protein